MPYLKLDTTRIGWLRVIRVEDNQEEDDGKVLFEYVHGTDVPTVYVADGVHVAADNDGRVRVTNG